jgi:tetratricopeptide (TPR) repeat protein
MRRDEYGPAPWTLQQSRFATARQPVRILKGHPGSGKTTALLHAADASAANRVLYLTFSRDLAVMASEYFGRYCSGARTFQVLTFDTFMRRLLGVETAPASDAEMRSRFRGDLVPFSRSLGPWTDHIPALYDEMHAHLVGAALPAAAGRFPAHLAPRASDKDYRSRRIRFLGENAASCVLDLASRLERNNPSLASRYFPELDLAWRAAAAFTPSGALPIAPEFFNFDCIAVDECQDLTPLEAFVTVALASAIGRHNRGRIPVFYAGDEAQTVRPTDFEWGWMNDLLHDRLGTPQEFKLASNLRSPRLIAQLVNHVWDLYGRLEKRDRPSGTGYAEIEDDATDQVLYCTTPPGDELNRCLEALSAREGLAIVSYDDTLAAKIPAPLRPSLLTPREVKGLDFHTVCLVNAGQQLEKIVRSERDRDYLTTDIEGLRRRLAIDQLRVGISRPADRLLWLDVAPSSDVVRSTIAFLNQSGQHAFSPSVPEALLRALEEEQLDLDERIQRCQIDARQFLAVRPEIAWSRAQQAVALLGDPQNPHAIQDKAVRRAAGETLAEICFCLGVRGAHLPPELGRPDLFNEAARACRRPNLAAVIGGIGRVLRADRQERLLALGDLAQAVAHCKNDLEPWILTEISAKLPVWLDELESAVSVGDNAVTLARILPPFYLALNLPDAKSRRDKLLDRCVRHLVKNKRHHEALETLRLLPTPRPDLEADCLEALGDFPAAAQLYRSIGKLKEALACYRAAPDFESAAALIREIPGHPAADSFDWLLRLRALLGERPENFNRVITPPEKKLLEQMLEQALGVQRKSKATTKKAATKRAATPKKRAPRPPNPFF